MKTVVQIWLSEEGKEIVKYAMKVQNKVICLPPQQAKYTPPQTETPSEFSPTKSWKPGTYTTPTGKTVKVAIFTTETGEQWVSSEVPFGVVKVVEQGKDKLKLYDFDFSGAKREISKTELETCQVMQFPMPGMTPIG